MFSPETAPAFSFAFQPIVDAETQRNISWEALIRGPHGEPAASVLSQITPVALYPFDEWARSNAIDLACSLGIDCDINLNFLPGALCASETALALTLEATQRHHLAPDRIVIEISETERVPDPALFVDRISLYRAAGIRISIDDFGAGHSGLNLLVDFQPDQVKLDMKLVRGIHAHGPRQAIVRGICQTCFDLAIDIVAEGVETAEEYCWLRSEGIRLFQGHLFARPALQAAPRVTFPWPTFCS
ncbi:MAG: EAL domain-containing protein, partial [Acidobacteriota bacterium]